ncbi:MAG: Rrf2 family transcriptional regulator [Bacilli bacterium]|nr:Rrf2 family transcriptional regulator [Bacilli bacterium]
MKLSSRTITAIKMFIDLGEHYDEGYISLVDIANRKDLSKKFLEQIVPLYKTNDLLLGNRGNQGGYRLAKSPNQISLKDIVYISETNLGKNSSNDYIINDVVDGLDKLIDDYFASITLDKLIEKEQSSYSNSYCI